MRILCLLAVLWAALVSPASAERVVVFAAASLQTALDAVAAGYAAESGHEVVTSYAGSAQLARQIAAGAPADVFISANAAWMDALEADGRLEAGTRGDLLGNRLVLVAPGAEGPELDLTAEALEARLDGGRLAMALVEAVPAGIYGRAALETLGLWDGVAAQVAEADNVRGALALVAAGAAPLGLVYASDAVAEPRVHVVAELPGETHETILYPVAIVAGRAGEAALGFLDYVRGPGARAVFEAQGFSWEGP